MKLQKSHRHIWKAETLRIDNLETWGFEINPIKFDSWLGEVRAVLKD